MTVAPQELHLALRRAGVQVSAGGGHSGTCLLPPGGTTTARMHAHPCPAAISVPALERVVVWGNRGWFAGEPGDLAPAADMADTHQTLPLLSHCAALLCLCFARVFVYVRAGLG